VRGLTEPTPPLDFTNPAIQCLIAERGWRGLGIYQRIGAICEFVRDEIDFGYTVRDDLFGSRVLADGRHHSRPCVLSGSAQHHSQLNRDIHGFNP
jgi:hypothetical protein